MAEQFFEKPILNSPYSYPSRHWELDPDGQPTNHILEQERSADFVSPVPKDDAQSRIDEESWETLHSDTSRPFDKLKTGRIAVKVINHLGDEVMKVFSVM